MSVTELLHIIAQVEAANEERIAKWLHSTANSETASQESDEEEAV